MKGTRLQSLLQRALAVQLVLAVAVVVAAVALFVGYREEARRGDEVRQSQLALQALRGEVLSAETGLRGYAITLDPSFLEPYEQAFVTIERQLTQLRAQLPSAQQGRLRATAATVQDWRENFAERALTALRSGRRGTALRLFDSGTGKRRIDRVRRLVTQMAAAERLRLSTERDRLESRAAVGLTAIGLGALMVFAGAFMLRRWLVASVVRPVVELAGAAQAFGHGDLTRRAHVGGVAETVTAATSFNTMAERIEEMVARLRELDELKTSFVSSVSHELRTPLTSMKGFLGELSDPDGDSLTPDQREMLAIVERNAATLEALIDDVLLLARLEARHLPLAQDTVALAAVLEDLCAELRPLVRERELELALDVAAAGEVSGDRLRLRQTFANLLSNAIKFSPPGGRVDVRAAGDAHEAVVEVADQGPGIPADEIAHISERFFRASTARAVKGTGLGLTIAREIAELHGGRLEVSSTVGAGSRFRIHLPREGCAGDARQPGDAQAGGGR